MPRLYFFVFNVCRQGALSSCASVCWIFCSPWYIWEADRRERAKKGKRDYGSVWQKHSVWTACVCVDDGGTR